MRCVCGVHVVTNAVVARSLFLAAAKQVLVVVVPELFTEEVKCQRVDARVDEAQAEAHNLEDVPEHVVQTGVIVVPENVDVARQPADDEHNHK